MCIEAPDSRTYPHCVCVYSSWSCCQSHWQTAAQVVSLDLKLKFRVRWDTDSLLSSLFSSPVLPSVFSLCRRERERDSSYFSFSSSPFVFHTNTSLPAGVRLTAQSGRWGSVGGGPRLVRLLLTYNNEDYEGLINEIGKADIARCGSVCVFVWSAGCADLDLIHEQMRPHVCLCGVNVFVLESSRVSEGMMFILNMFSSSPFFFMCISAFGCLRTQVDMRLCRKGLRLVCQGDAICLLNWDKLIESYTMDFSSLYGAGLQGRSWSALPEKKVDLNLTALCGSRLCLI